MTLPQQEHNSLLATREFLKLLLDEERYPDIPEKIRFSAKSLLNYYPERSKIDQLYSGNTFLDFIPLDDSDITEEERENNNKILNNNQTWETPGFKWKTEVEFISVNQES
jgi:hypothetical protein